MICAWDEEETDAGGVQPWPGVWVHHGCDHWAWHEATPEELGRYLDKVRP